MIEAGFKFGLGIVAAGVALWAGALVVVIALMLFGEMFGHQGDGNK